MPSGRVHRAGRGARPATSRPRRYAGAVRPTGLVLVLLAALAGGCGGDAEEAAPPSTVTVTVEQTTETAPVTTDPADDPCAQGDVASAVERGLGEWVARVELVRCRNAHARASAFPEEGAMLETADVLLRLVGDAWEVVDYGTSIGCEEETLPPARAANRRACAALGYPQPAILAGASFRLPSRNIGCRAGGGALRCDVLTGLRPEPGAPCELDWVGVVMEPRGPAEPLCAGDTAYDASAQTLAYGDLWHRGPFWCRSSESGLLCVNRDLEGSFELARERWSAG